MAINTALFSSYLFRRTPNFMKEIVEDMIPRDIPNLNLYEQDSWASFTGTEHTWDRFHVNMPNDAGDWEQMRADDCLMQICDPEPRQIDWGSTRAVFGKFRRAWQTRLFCLDQLRHVEEAKAQLTSIWKGLSKVPEYVMSDWLKYQQVLGATNLFVCGSAGATVTVSASMFGSNGGMQTLNVGTDANLPTSKLTMNYLERQIYALQLNGYFDGEFTPTGKMQMFTDIDSVVELCNGNPALAGMYKAADFEKGGELFKYGAMNGCGNFMFKNQPYPVRFYRSGNGQLTRVWPFPNVPTTVGSMPQLDAQYLNAPYQLSVIVHRKARKIFMGDIPSVHPEWKFGTRNLLGKWKWVNDAAMTVYDPTTGAQSTVTNPRRNKGYFLGDYEAGVENQRPELECVILHQREAPAVADMPRAAGAATVPTLTAQNLLPYNAFCNPNPGEETFLSNAGIADFGGVTPGD